jgi:hypothetical protein
MSKDFSISIGGIKEISAAFKSSPVLVSKRINEAIKKSIITLLGEARKAETAVDTGYLRSPSMKTEFGNMTGSLKNTSKYSIFVHEGTRPHWPPIQAITPWAKRHGIPPFLVARSIARKGTKAVPFFDIAVQKSQNRIDQYFSLATENITKDLAV